MKRIFKIAFKVISIFIAIGCICLIAWSFWVTGANNVKHKSNPVVIQAKNPNGKKALLIYQSGRTNFAKNIANEMGKGISDSGYQVYMNYPGKFLPTDLKEYSMVVFGSPVYLGSYSKVLKNYIKSIKDFSGKKVVIYSTGGSEESKELDNMENLFQSRKVDKKIKFLSGNRDEAKQRAYKAGVSIGIE